MPTLFASRRSRALTTNPTKHVTLLNPSVWDLNSSSSACSVAASYKPPHACDPGSTPGMRICSCTDRVPCRDEAVQLGSLVGFKVITSLADRARQACRSSLSSLRHRGAPPAACAPDMGTSCYTDSVPRHEARAICRLCLHRGDHEL